MELDLKHLKTSSEIDVLHSKTPEIVRKEIREWQVLQMAMAQLQALVWNFQR